MKEAELRDIEQRVENLIDQTAATLPPRRGFEPPSTDGGQAINFRQETMLHRHYVMPTKNTATLD